MKNNLFLALLGLILVTSSCQKEIRTPKSELKAIDGILFLNQEKFTGTVYENYADGQLLVEWEVLKGMQNGNSTIFHPNGQLDEKSIWEDGEKNGAYEKFYDNGQMEIKSHFVFDKKDGAFETFFKNGK